ncbi:MAG TPA: DegT/DnrJ/EryC1/StrS family aminotransferase [Thermoanaerobaculia bacterium]|jgi:perosamine synthetase|nr:DegT/DnrJ/EryC1/StrS family aminotransferase [Thermoanaerobaculia bacterium]
MTAFIPVSSPAFLGNETRYVNECLASTWVSSIGAFIEEFERRVAAYCQTGHAVSCMNGTVALHLALLGLGIGPGDEVLVPSLTYVASANAVRYCGAEPVFVDSDRRTWNLDPADLERKITPRTRAVMAVHLYGKPAPMAEILAIARSRGLAVVEDVAEAIGATYGGRPAGSLGDVAAFSFFGNKVITCGEGGMVLTDDPALGRKIRQLKGQGQDFERRYWFPVVGYNYRMTNIQAALGLAQLERIDDHLAARDEIDGWYRQELAGHEEITLQARDDGERSICWLFSGVLAGHPGAARDEVMARLRQAGVDSRPFFYPCHVLPPYQTGRPGACPEAEWLGARGLSLPTWVGMTREQVRHVSATLLAALAAVEAAAAG